MVLETINPGAGRLVVGVDFGTTFTSVAFAHSAIPGDVKLVQSWPNSSTGSDSAEQVPTELHYIQTPPAVRAFLWGYEIPTASRGSSPPLKWFKLLLQNPKGRPEYSTLDNLTSSFRNMLPSTHARFSPFGSQPPSATCSTASDSGTPAFKTAEKLATLNIAPVTVVQDFLSSIREVTKESMESTWNKAFVEKCKLEYIITIPAIWSDKAKGLMVQAIEAAGYGKHRVNFHLVSEPEAAAAHTLKVIQPHDIKADDTFIICDAGGGTVDLISYKIRTMNPLVLDEVVSGSGDLCGSVYLDEGFRKYIEGVLGHSALSKMSARSVAAMENAWQTRVKFKFTTAERSRNVPLEVVVPGIPDNELLDIEDNFHIMKRESVQQIFDPIINRIIRLVRDQVDAVEAANHKVAAILLVGGFGCSPYLFERLKAESFGADRKSLEIIQPINGGTAIARGALLRGLDGSSVRDKRARRHYGVEASCLLTSHPGGVAKSYYCEIEGVTKVDGCMSWHVKKNAILHENESIELAFYRKVPVSHPNFIFTDDILQSECLVAPEFSWEPATDVRTVCTLTSNLTSAPVQSMPIIYGRNGLRYYRVDFKIRMTMESDVLKFEVVHNGKSYGEAKTKFQ